MNAEIPKSLGRYEIDAEIGRGMMGVVYRAFDPALGRSIALKTVSLAFAVAADQRESFEKRFLAEARVAAALAHPGIVVVHDLGRDPETGTLFIALELLEGRTLAETTSEGAPMDWRRALRLTQALAQALHHAHSQGIVHRDIKPANIMILPNGEPKIMDFGIAKIPASQLTSAGEFFGTPSYMSPEQAAGEPLDGRSDLFSLGAVLYLLLTGRRAFDGESVPAILARLSTQDPPPPSQIVEGLPEGVDILVSRALAKHPEDRYPSGQALAEDIEDALEGRAPRHGTPEPRGGTLVSPAPGLRTPRRGSIPPPPDRPSLLERASSRLGRWGWIAPAVLGALGLLAALLLGGRGERGSLPLAGLTLSRPEPPARLEVGMEYSFKSGRLQVWIDDDPVLDEGLESHVVKKVLSLRVRKGVLKKSVDVPAGEHSVRVQVEADGETQSRKTRGTFQGGATKHLEIQIGGLLKKDLSLEWWS